jgi:acylphosphatase
MSDLAALHAVVYGHVQGVFFRAFVANQAVKLGLTGYVLNRETQEAVEVWAEGEKERLEELVNHLKIGPPHSRVERVTLEWLGCTGRYRDFRIENS